MSTAVAVNRPPADVSPTAASSVFCSADHRMANRCAPATNLKPANIEQLEEKLQKALRERDEQWRRHEKAQIAFLQNETSNMLKSLHQEVHRLTNELREAKRQSAMGETGDSKRIEELETIVAEKESYIKNVERKVTATIQKLQEQITVQSERIRQLNDELNDRNQTVTHLSQQIRAIKLREAMATSTHRRRASQQSSSPIVSPSSPHRIFPQPSSGLLSASVAVTYPGSSSKSSSSVSLSSTGSSGSRRSISAMRAPSMPN
ncbi:unnamed protein product [Caenorhabditis bovis]|uniref:CCDC92/74 N-terminal domain-containing protein n=1 Tax=Caenorhabditis bovis TaxID=2654633 RepID=A0A8S1EXH3_9PELO|nr:unnamed protein product [Caenorhabditis bovis]